MSSDVNEWFFSHTSCTYDKRYNCNGDRRGNHQRLHPNQYLCAHRDRYYFGVTENGYLVCIDSKENVTQTWMQGYPGSSFSLQDNDTPVLENRKIGNIKSHHAKQKFKNINWTERCLRKFECKLDWWWWRMGRKKCKKDLWWIRFFKRLMW